MPKVDKTSLVKSLYLRQNDGSRGSKKVIPSVCRRGGDPVGTGKDSVLHTSPNALSLGIIYTLFYGDFFEFNIAPQRTTFPTK